jgi:hypothetical protein
MFGRYYAKNPPDQADFLHNSYTLNSLLFAYPYFHALGSAPHTHIVHGISLS